MEMPQQIAKWEPDMYVFKLEIRVPVVSPLALQFSPDKYKKCIFVYEF